MSGCCGAWSGLRIDLRVAQGGWGAGVEGVGGVALRCGAYGAVCFHLERRLMVFSIGGNTQPQPAGAASGRVFYVLGSDCTPFFSLFYGGTGVGMVHRSHCHIISYHIISKQQQALLVE